MWKFCSVVSSITIALCTVSSLERVRVCTTAMCQLTSHSLFLIFWPKHHSSSLILYIYQTDIARSVSRIGNNASPRKLYLRGFSFERRRYWSINKYFSKKIIRHTFSLTNLICKTGNYLPICFGGQVASLNCKICDRHVH